MNLIWLNYVRLHGDVGDDEGAGRNAIAFDKNGNQERGIWRVRTRAYEHYASSSPPE